MVNIYEPQTAESQNVEEKFTCEELGVDGCEGRVPACFAHLWERHFSINIYFKNDGLDHWVIQDARWWTPPSSVFEVGRGDSLTHPYIVVAFLPLLVCSKNVAEL